MRITRIKLSHFKAHDELEIEPAAGLTVVRGPNEAGKSSLQQALELALFRKADANREDIRRAWSWGSEAPPEVELDFEVEGVAGSLRKRFDGSRSEAELRLDGQTIHDHQLIEDRLAELIGVPSESFYRATASVSHADLGAVAGAQAAIGDRLQKAVSGADRGTAKAKQKLKDAVHRYRTAGQVNPGLLKVARAEIDQLERDLAEGEEALGRLEADRAAWVVADERRAELDTTVNRLQADLAEARRAEALVERRDAAQARWQRLKRAAELSEEAAQLQRALPATVSVTQVRSAVARLQALEYETSELEAEIATADEAAAIDEPAPVPPRPMAALAAAALLVVVGWVSMLLLRGAGLVGIVVVAVIAVAVTVALVQAARLAGRRRQYGLAMRLAEYATAQHDQQARTQTDQLRQRQREARQLLDGLDVADVDAAVELLATVERQAEQVAQVEGELRGLGVEGTNTRRVAEARDEAADEAEMARHALAAMGAAESNPTTTRSALERDLARTSSARDEARSDADRARGRVDANPIDAELVAGLAERLATARERGAEMEARVSVYEATLAAIEAAEAATLKTAARFLEERMGPTIEAVTDGRYDEVEVDERSLAFRVRAPETGELIDVEQLSQGTADQLYLAARLGLVRLVTLDRRPPLILDDPFVTFDPGRAERALRRVKQLCREQGFQALYLTCSERYDRLADELVLLPPPSSERVLAQPRAPESARASGWSTGADHHLRTRSPAQPRPPRAASRHGPSRPGRGRVFRGTAQDRPRARGRSDKPPGRVAAARVAAAAPLGGAGDEPAAADPLAALREAALHEEEGVD